MISTDNIQAEKIRLLFVVFEKLQYPSFFYMGALVFTLYAYVSIPYLLVWSAITCMLHSAQIVFARQYLSKSQDNVPYKHWQRHLALRVLCLGLAWSILPLLATKLPILCFVAIMFLSFLGAFLFASFGYKLLFMLYATPISLGISVASAWVMIDYWHLMSLIFILEWFLFLAVANHFEKSLEDSIRIRFEKEHLIEKLQTQTLRAEVAVKAKSVFISSASHDIRQPLHALGLYASTMQTLLTHETQVKVFNMMDNCIGSVRELFENIMDVSKLDSGTVIPVIDNVSVDDLLQKLSEQFMPLAQEKGLLLTMDKADFVVNTDAILLERILANVIQNAIKYTERGSVHVLTHRVNDCVTLTIKDTGVGIAPEELNHIFTDFYQLNHSSHYRAQGLRLGLSIVKKLCALLNLNLRVDSHLGEGTTFDIGLPVGDLTIHSKHSHCADIRGAHVLVLDDDDAILASTRHLLSCWGCDVVAVRTFEKLIGSINTQWIPDLILADWDLDQNKTGVDVVHFLRNNLRVKIPAIIMTGDTSKQTMEAVFVAGYNLLYKPVSPEALREQITMLLNKAEDISKAVESV